MADALFDKAIKYGYRYGGHQGLTVPATSADYVNRLGAMFVYIDAGIARPCASNTTTLDGWLEVPKETTHGESVQLTSGEYFVITSPSAVFEAPVDSSAASLAASHIGESAFCVESGSTTSKYQKVKLALSTCSTPLLLIRDVDTDNKTVFVSINPAKYHVG